MPRQGPDQGGTERGHRARQGQQGPVLEAENQHQASALVASQDKDRPPRGGQVPTGGQGNILKALGTGAGTQALGGHPEHFLPHGLGRGRPCPHFDLGLPAPRL